MEWEEYRDCDEAGLVPVETVRADLCSLHWWWWWRRLLRSAGRWRRWAFSAIRCRCQSRVAGGSTGYASLTGCRTDTPLSI